METKSFNSPTWFNWQQPATPLFLGLTFEACGKPFRDFWGFPCFTSVLYYRDVGSGRGYQASWLLRTAEGEACGRLLVDLLSLSSFRSHFDRLVAESFGNVLAQANILADTDLRPLGDRELLDIHHQFCEAFVHFYCLTAITEPVQWHVASVVNEFIAADASRDEPILPKEWSRERIESALFSVTEESYVSRIERDQIRLAEALEELSLPSEELAKLEANSLESFLGENEDFAAAAEDHVRRFRWKSNNYREVKDLTPLDVTREAIEMRLKHGEATSAQLRRRFDESTARRESMIADRTHLLADAPNLVRIAVRIGDEFGGWLADRRKAVMLESLRGLAAVGKELARRSDISYGLVKLLDPRDLTSLLDEASDFANHAEARQIGLVQVQAPFPIDNSEMSAYLALGSKSQPIVPRKLDLSLAEGAEATRLLDELDASMGLFESEGGPGVARGDVVVSPKDGETVEGRCRIITDPREEDFVSGEVLIATSTTPDFMPAIRKAAALVVDQGGSLSHAAIVSRELGKPCIVGASIATAIFQTGDSVVLDFADGTVRLSSISTGVDR